MADTLANILIPKNTWVDLYAATGIVVGVQIIVQNLGACDLYAASQASAPTDLSAYQVIEFAKTAANEAGDAGAWVYSLNCDGLVNVRVA